MELYPFSSYDTTTEQLNAGSRSFEVKKSVSVKREKAK